MIWLSIKLTGMYDLCVHVVGIEPVRERRVLMLFGKARPGYLRMRTPAKGKVGPRQRSDSLKTPQLKKKS